MNEPNKLPGQKVSQGAYSAFIPAPLPPAFEWTPWLIRALSDADRLIGRLAGEGGRLPNPHVLIRPFIRREAVLSSKIEGTQATLGELAAAEAGAVVDRSPGFGYGRTYSLRRDIFTYRVSGSPHWLSDRPQVSGCGIHGGQMA